MAQHQSATTASMRTVGRDAAAEIAVVEQAAASQAVAVRDPREIAVASAESGVSAAQEQEQEPQAAQQMAPAEMAESAHAPLQTSPVEIDPQEIDPAPPLVESAPLVTGPAPLETDRRETGRAEKADPTPAVAETAALAAETEEETETAVSCAPPCPLA